MGYRPPTTGQKLDFTGTPYEGLEVTVDSAPIGVVLDITALFAAARQPGADTAAAVRELLAKFAGVLEGWNVEDRAGGPVPPTLEGVLSLDTAFVMAVVEAWLTGTTSAGDDLGKDSGSGGSSAAGLTAMAALSSSLPSSSPQRS
jgi:hypothetical protein